MRTPTGVRAPAASAPPLRARPDGLVAALHAWLDERRRPLPLQLFLVRAEYAKKND